MDFKYSFAENNYSLFEISFADWLAVAEPPFFNQLSDQTEAHWLFLQKTANLKGLVEIVLLVKLDAVVYKLDGNIRKQLWQAGKLQTPDHLIAQVFDITQADWSALNHESQLKRVQSLAPNEVIQEIYKKLGLEFTSERIKSGYIYDALNIALRGRPRNLQDKRLSYEREEIDMNKAVQLFSKELALIDSLNPKPDIFVTGVLAAALIMLGTHRDLHDYFLKVNTGQVEFKEGLEDPVAGLIRAIERHRIDDRSMPAHLSIELCRKTIQSITLWEEGKASPLYWRRKLVSGVDHMPYIREMKRAKHIDDQRNL